MSDLDDKDFEIRAPYVQKILELQAALASQADQVRKLEAQLVIASTSVRASQSEINLVELEDELAQLKQGRTNAGDETSGTVPRFGIDATKLPLEVIPSTNGAYVWYSDYLELHQQLAQANETIVALEAEVKEFDAVMGDQTTCINDQHNQIAAQQTRIEAMLQSVINESTSGFPSMHKLRRTVEAIATTDDLSALKEHDAKVLEDAAAQDIRAKLAWCKETSAGFATHKMNSE